MGEASAQAKKTACTLTLYVWEVRADEVSGLVRHRGSPGPRECGGCRLRNPGWTGARQHRRDRRRPAAGPLRPGAADQLRHLQGRLGGAPCPRHPRPGAGRRHGLLGQFLRRPRARARKGLLHRRAHGPDPEEGVPVQDDVVARSQGVVRPRLRRDLQAIGDRRARLRRACQGEGSARGLLQPPQRRLSEARQEHRVPRRGDQVRLPAPELRQDHRRGIQAGRRVQGPGGHEREDSLRAGGWSRRPTRTSPPRWR